MDESGLFYYLQPDKAILSGPDKGCKKAKDCAPLVFCTNAGGSDKKTELNQDALKILIPLFM